MSDLDFADFPLVAKGNKFEDFTVGRVLTHHWGRTFTAGDNAIFSTAMCHWSPMYLNAEFARAHGHPDVVVNPMLVLCTVVGLSVEDLSGRAARSSGRGLHVPPSRASGDLVTARSEVVDARTSESRKGVGIVTWHTEAHNQRGELVVDYRRTNLVAKRAPS